MNRREREALINKLHADNARDLADIAARQQRRLLGEEPEMWVTPEDAHAMRQYDQESLIYKRYETPTQPAQPVQLQAAVAPTMDAVTQAAWDRWATSIAKAYAKAAVEVAGEEVDKSDLALRALIAEMRTTIEGLRAGLDELRGEIAQLRVDLDNLEVRDAADAA